MLDDMTPECSAANALAKHFLMSTGTLQHDLLYPSCPAVWTACETCPLPAPFCFLLSSLHMFKKATCLPVILKYAEEAPQMDISEKVTAPPDSSSRSHFQHACGRWLTVRSLLLCASPGKGAARNTYHPATYTTVRQQGLCVCGGGGDISCASPGRSSGDHRMT